MSVIYRKSYEKGRYDEEDYKTVKDLKKDTEENINMFEEILTYLDSVYSAKPAKKEDEMKELVENLELIEKRRDTMRKKVKEANIAIEKKETKKKLRGTNKKEMGEKEEE